MNYLNANILRQSRAVNDFSLLQRHFGLIELRLFKQHQKEIYKGLKNYRHLYRKFH